MYAQEAMVKTAGFAVGWMVWVTWLSAWAILNDGLVGYLGTLWAPARAYQVPITVGLVALLCLLNTLGTRIRVRHIVSGEAITQKRQVVVKGAPVRGWSS